MVKSPCYHCRGHRFDPSWGTKIAYAAGCGQNNNNNKKPRKHTSCMCVCSVASITSRLFATPRTVARQSALSVKFSMQEYWGGCHILLQRSFQPRDQTHISCDCCNGGRFFTTEPPGKPRKHTGFPSNCLDVSSIKNRGRPGFDP